MRRFDSSCGRRPEPLSERQSRGELPTEIVELAERAAAGDVVWGAFDIFETDDE
jgi:hypothetical protein